MSMPGDHLWYKDAVLYELHVKAFQDGSHDGVGDFRGLVTRLDYLQDLGVDCIWLLPFYPSPLRDDGYDIADPYGVHSNYGSIEDLQAFLDESHRRGIRVIADLVLNHTSDQSAWFQRARRSPKGSPERNWYVWSDSDAVYQDARIIFTDTEPSNWTWDPVAQQYYWHRFFAHQPDLNWENPQVKETMFQVMEYWLDRGLDGFRADAVPYLIEREGTSCENLVETHGILKEFRARIQLRYPDRILLAEANQWPDDVRPYFGDGDEFHLAFHFPLMPRIFMAVRQGIRAPIVEIIERTPSIPAECQWCMFLRNHDELTLEMVTDEERDYMYREYAADPRMRLNLGIRRRLAPLMENDRRKIELLNSILFTMPGTPIIYYGDEIGMGDNIYLGDRDGVRTPMQWSPDRNAGFSRAEPQKLYLPVLNDSVYGFQAVNVEAQERSPFSLLNWMKRLIQVRKAHRAFGRGSIEFLTPENQHVLAYVREYEGDVILVVNNLSGTAQAERLDLRRFVGCVPIELLGHTEFLPIDDSPYALTLSPYGFFWFAIRRPTDALRDVDDAEIARLVGEWSDEDASLVANSDAVAGLLAELSPDWIQQQRWFRSKARQIAAVEHYDFGSVAPERAARGLLEIVRVRYTEGDAEYYLLPLSLRSPLRADTEPIAILTVTTAHREVSLYEALNDSNAAQAFLDIIGNEAELTGGRGRFRGRTTAAFADLEGSSEPARPIYGEQTNSSVTFGERAILKMFRKLEAGINPDIEISRFLVEHTDFRAVPALAGWLDYIGDDGMEISVGGLYRFVPNHGDAWVFTRTRIERFFNAASRNAADPQSVSGQASLRRMAGDFFDVARTLGRVTGDLHRALASASPEHPSFVPEPITDEDVSGWVDASQRAALEVLEDVGRRLEAIPGSFPAGSHNDLAAIIRDAPDLRLRIEDLRLLADAGVMKVRTHGDYHLGQLLRARNADGAGGEWVILDFEGEPARSLAERRGKRSPIRDVAGMLRSFSYAVQMGIRNFQTDDFMVRNALRMWGGAWEATVRSEFLTGYRAAIGDAPFAPTSDAAFERVLAVFELEKALYELGYEMNNRPDWIWVPVAGILSLKGSAT
ncbi:MAG: maltose alpha-D-glucosyltransferase [Gemmatimonas sp.]|nr:maltose alpha-D-glucosyltransferase [Gemmatimonas sp.]